MADTGPSTLSLFSGVGGLDLAWELATGARVVGYCERDAYAASTLLARMEDQALEPAPIWCGDVTELPLAPFHGVDAIIGGFPCQDISAAGAGAGIDGERSGLWGRAFVPAIRELRPPIVFVENVRALVTRGLDVVLGDLADLGYDTEWTSIRASAVGAPHRRERVFILGYAKGFRWCEGWTESERLQRRHDAVQSGGALADDNGDGREREPQPGVCRPDAADADRCRAAMGNAARIQQSQPESRRGVFPPAPSDAQAWNAAIDGNSALAPALERDFRDLADGLAPLVGHARADALRCVGNGVVALQAAVAARLLLRRLGVNAHG